MKISIAEFSDCLQALARQAAKLYEADPAREIEAASFLDAARQVGLAIEDDDVRSVVVNDFLDEFPT